MNTIHTGVLRKSATNFNVTGWRWLLMWALNNLLVRYEGNTANSSVMDWSWHLQWASTNLLVTGKYQVSMCLTCTSILKFKTYLWGPQRVGLPVTSTNIS